VTAADAVDNGWVVALTGITATSSDLWTAAKPATGTLANLWMVHEPEVSQITDTYITVRNINVDPRLAYTAGTKVFSVFHLEVADEIWLTDACLANTQGSNTFVNATDTTGGYNMYWGATQTASVTSFRLLGDHYYSLPVSAITNTIGTNRVTIHRFEVLYN
jgi:hypothetical protein